MAEQSPQVIEPIQPEKKSENFSGLSGFMNNKTGGIQESATSEPKADESKKDNASTETAPPKEPVNKFAPATEGEIKNTGEKFKSYEEMEKPELIKVTKTFQSKLDKTTYENQRLVQELKTRDDRLNYIMNNPMDAFKQLVPELGSMAEMMASPETLVKEWQKTELMKSLKERYPGEVDENWRPTPEDMATPGTPSYDWQKRTMQKHMEIESMANSATQQRQQIEQQNQAMQQYADQINREDIAFMQESYGLTQEDMLMLAKKYDNILAESQKSNDPYPENHPYRLKNVLRGIFFDEFMDMARKQTAEQIHAEYAAKGISLPKNPLPMDVADMKKSDTGPVDQKGAKPFTNTLLKFIT